MALRRACNRHASAGVTLLELVVVMTIAGLLLMLAPPIVSGLLPRIGHEAAAREVAAALRETRLQAVARNQPVDLYVDVDAKRYWTTGGLRDRSLPSGVDIRLYGAASLAPDERSGGIRFYPDGSSTGGQITLSRGERQYRIDVDWLLGTVQVGD